MAGSNIKKKHLSFNATYRRSLSAKPFQKKSHTQFAIAKKYIKKSKKLLFQQPYDDKEVKSVLFNCYRNQIHQTLKKHYYRLFIWDN